MWAPHPVHPGLLQPSWLTKLPSQKRSLPEERPSVLPGSSELNDVPSEPKSRLSLTQQIPSTTPLGMWKSDARLKKMFERDETLLSDEVRAALGEQLGGRTFVVRRRGLMAKSTTRAVAYSASEVYANLPSVVEDWGEYKPELGAELADLPRIPLIRSAPAIGCLQVIYDALFPAAIGVDFSRDAEIVEQSPLHLSLGRIAVDTSAPGPLPEKYDTLVPMLRTIIPSRRPMSLTELLLGFQKRNANVPRISSGLLPDALADVAYVNFLASAVGGMAEFETFASRPIEICEQRFDARVKAQPNEAVQRYLSRSDLRMDEKMTNVFSYMIKVALKPPVQNSDAMTYQSVQTIAFSSKDINAIFSPIVVEMSKRWQGVLKDKYKYYTRMSPEAFERVFNAHNSVEELFSVERVENDISKYDKSMGPWYLLFETRLYRALGMPDWLVDIWYGSHVVSRYTERESGFSAEIEFQRRSGDASTFFGNTLVNHCAAMAIYADDDLRAGVFAGDDAVLFGTNITFDASGAYADTFNFESKTFSQYKYPYFCGKFMLQQRSPGTGKCSITTRRSLRTTYW